MLFIVHVSGKEHTSWRRRTKSYRNLSHDPRRVPSSPEKFRSRGFYYTTLDRVNYIESGIFGGGGGGRVLGALPPEGTLLSHWAFSAEPNAVGK